MKVELSAEVIGLGLIVFRIVRVIGIALIFLMALEVFFTP